jgi:hypothetical protein
VADSYLHIDGWPIEKLALYQPWIGPWWAEALMVEDHAHTGAVTLTVGDTIWQGTVDPSASGMHQQRARVRIVAGGGGWGKALEPKGYHNDARVSARLVADDAARAVGETLAPDGFAPLSNQLQTTYTRTAGPASQALEYAAGGEPWWVAPDGSTHVGRRDTPTADGAMYDVLEYDPSEQRALLSTDIISAIGVGFVLDNPPLEAPITVRDLTIRISPAGLLVDAWCGGTAVKAGHRAQLMRDIVERTTDAKLYGLYEYRVVRMVANRVQLQAVHAIDDGVPDLALVSMRPGCGGAHATLEAGAEVLVQFIAGDRGKPVITHFADVDGPGHIPAELALCGDTFKAARQGDVVQSAGRGTIVMFAGVAPMAPGEPYYISFGSELVPPVLPTPTVATPLYGSIITGSGKVKTG